MNQPPPEHDERRSDAGAPWPRRVLLRLLSPGALLVAALLIVLPYATLGAAGARAHTSMLCGQFPDSPAALLGGLAYILAHFAFYLAAPVLVLAACILWLLLRRCAST